MSRIFIIAALMAVQSACGAPPAASIDASSSISGETIRFARLGVELPGKEPGDLVVADAGMRRLLVTHSGGIHILDLDSLKRLTSMSGMNSTGGVALATNKGFASDTDDNAIVVFDPVDGVVQRRIPAGDAPGAMVFDPASRMLFVFNRGSKDVSVLNTEREAIVKTITLNDVPEHAQLGANRRIFFTLKRSHAIGVIDAEAGILRGSFVLPDCDAPSGLAVDEFGGRLFSSCVNGTLKVVDDRSGSILAGLTVAKRPRGLVYDQSARRIVVAGTGNSWSIVDQVGPDVYVLKRPRGFASNSGSIAFDPLRRRLFSYAADLPASAGSGTDTFRLMVASET